jgi:Tetratricopeptide repeat
MADSPRIDDLRRRVQKDPASIAFAQLAEECRRAGEYQESIDVCRAGLALHPGYLSARVTLGRALIEVDQLDEAQAELEVVLASASENLAAIRGLAEIFHRRGALADALKQYRVALTLARNDPDLERTVAELSRAIEPKPAEPALDGLSFEQMADEFMKNLPPPPSPVAVAPVVETAPVVDVEPVVEATPVVEAAPVIETAADVETAPVVEAMAGVQDAVGVDAASLSEPSPAVASYGVPEALPSPEMDAAAPAVWEEGERGSDTVSDPVSDTVSDPSVADVAADGPSGHNGIAHDLAPVAVETLIPSPHASSAETALPVDWIGQQTQVPAVVLSEGPLASAADAALTDEDAAPPAEDASRAYSQATIAALDQWLDAIHVARADRRT